MKKSALTIFFAFLFSVSAFALTPTEITDAYNGCLQFLEMPSDQQSVIAGKSGVTLKAALWACHNMADRGLAKCLQDERERQATIYRSPVSPSVPKCTSNNQCRPHMQCVGGSCEDIGGPHGDCRNNGGCAGGYNCGSDGICR